ncbi:hypothetical protein Lalb_Chr24g0399731 [Lupinus albus]|uniref:Uncharacterized protein n=1 Tax=Lupinus albus TaxID=3870 RepID=A0A6A4NFZ5_LUPAL|nr:hypothetical protein Lalb_Chr24g0399731 [Lupinus albus]
MSLLLSIFVAAEVQCCCCCCSNDIGAVVFLVEEKELDALKSLFISDESDNVEGSGDFFLNHTLHRAVIIAMLAANPTMENEKYRKGSINVML